MADGEKFEVRIGKDCHITREDVLKAIKYYDDNHIESKNASSGFFIYENAKYPARLIGRIAYSLKAGMEIEKIAFKGGTFAVGYLEKLGFEPCYEKPSK